MTRELYLKVKVIMADTSPKWTPAQDEAIRTIDRSVIVSAAAGSGKTAVLAERCVHLIVDPESACDVDRLLVVTFTNDAAEEMRTRIEQRLRARLASMPLDDRLEKQLYLLQRAQISTIHGFCKRIIQQHFHLLGLDPGTLLLQAEEASLMRTQLLRDLIHDRYARANPERFEHLIAWYFDSNDERLVEAILRLHHLLTSIVDPRQWARDARKRITDAIKDLPSSELGGELLSLITAKLQAIISQCEDFTRTHQSVTGLNLYLAAAGDVKTEAMLRLTHAKNGDLDGVASAACAYEPMSLKGGVRGVDASIREPAKLALDCIRKEITGGDLALLCRSSAVEWSAGLRTTHDSIIQLLALTRQFVRRYQKAKRVIRSMDFSDLEHHALRILTDHPSVAAQYREQYWHVLVDEFQDINDVQKEILTRVSRESDADETLPANLFTVGDVKQSIYRFRLADPMLFLQRYEEFTTRAGARRKAIDLQSNFRSRKPLLGAVNLVFERLMTRETAEIDYDERQRLVAGTDYALDPAVHFKGTPVEIHLLEKPGRGDAETDAPELENLEDLDRSEREAMLVANRIDEMVKRVPAIQIFEKLGGQLIPVTLQYKHIVVLLRSRKVKAQQFSEQLQQSGIPVHAETGSGFFDSLEVRDVISLLRLLDNQQQDIPLAAVLRSPFANLPDAADAMARIHLACKDQHSLPFHQAVMKYAQLRTPLAIQLKAFLSVVQRWRHLAHRKPLAEVLAMIFNESGYLNWCAGLPNGRQRVANLLDLLERARQFGSFQRQGLSRFLDFLTRLEEVADLGQPSMLGEGENAVRIMTIHASKGLEFPVVFVADLGKQHNFQDLRSTVLSERKLGVALPAVDPVKRIRYESLSSMILKSRMHAASIAEELRVLYVAMTRAREHLVLVGTCEFACLDKWRDKWAWWKGAFPAADVRAGKTYLDWIIPSALATNTTSPGVFEIHQHSLAELEAVAGKRQRSAPQTIDQSLRAFEPLPSAPGLVGSVRTVIETISASYPFADISRTSASQSVTAAVKHGYDEPAETVRARAFLRPVSPLSAPRFLSGGHPVSPMDAGTATHLVLEHLDFSDASSIASIEKQINALVDAHLLLPAHAKVVDRDAIVWLMNSEAGGLLKQHDSALLREWPINFPQEVPGRCGLDLVMVRGRLDVLIPTTQGLVLIDYKTDRVNEQTLDARVAVYAPQLNAYAGAIERISSKPVIGQYLVFLTAKLLRKL